MGENGRRSPSVVDYRVLRPMVKIPRSVVEAAHLATRGAHPKFSFTLLSYNILAQDHINRPCYPYAGKDTLKWTYRKGLLATEMTAYDADIVCFQEMDRFHTYFQALFDQQGYDMAYYLRNGPDSDVNCVGWKRDKFKLVCSRQVSFEETTAALGSVPNVAQLVALQACCDESIKIIVATTHLYWRYDCDHIRLVQMHRLIEAVVSLREELGKEYALIVAGDFNSDPDSMAIQATLRSRFMLEPTAFEGMLRKSGLTAQALRALLADFTINWPRFQDAYEAYPSVVPGSNGYPLPYTSFCLYKGILDFILYAQFGTPSYALAPTALRLVPDRSVLEEEVALPNRIFPSDHLALECQFTVFHCHPN